MRESPVSVELSPILAAHWGDIKRIASATQGFTVPTDYILWMLSRLSPASQVVATQCGRVVGYHLAIPTANELFVWQLGVARRRGVGKTLGILCSSVAQVARGLKVHSIRFTCSDMKDVLMEAVATASGATPMSLGFVPEINETLVGVEVKSS